MNLISHKLNTEPGMLSVSQQFSHYHFTSKNIFRFVLYHILLYNTFTADLDRLGIEFKNIVSTYLICSMNMYQTFYMTRTSVGLRIFTGVFNTKLGYVQLPSFR